MRSLRLLTSPRRWLRSLSYLILLSLPTSCRRLPSCWQLSWHWSPQSPCERLRRTSCERPRRRPRFHRAVDRKCGALDDQELYLSVADYTDTARKHPLWRSCERACSGPPPFSRQNVNFGAEINIRSPPAGCLRRRCRLRICRRGCRWRWRLNFRVFNYTVALMPCTSAYCTCCLAFELGAEEVSLYLFVYM